MKAREYQANARNSTLQLWNEGKRSLLGCMPTGCGKTVVFSLVVQARFPRRTMVLAHRQELVWQARDKLQRVTGLHVDVEMGDYKVNDETGLWGRRAGVVVSTIQTHVAGGDGAGRMGKFDPMDFGQLIIDEAHHAVSPSYRRIVDYYMTNPNLVVLGVTATPDRADEEALGQVFDDVAFDYEILDAIHDGWLVPIDQQFVSVDSIDLSGVKTTAGDLNSGDLDEVMSREKNLHGIAGPTIDIIGDSKRGIGFASSVNHARVLCEIFNRHRRGMAAWVCGKTDKDERARIVSDFAKGNIQFLWNCGVFTEGFDDSGVEVISMGRPTKSRSLYAQMGGRGMRPHESIAHRLNDMQTPSLRRGMIARSCKPSCLIIDFVGNSGRHKLMSSADILGGNVSDEAVESAVEFAMRNGGRVRMSERLEIEEEEAELRKKKKEEEAAKKAHVVAKTTWKSQKVDPFDILGVKPVKPRGWDDGHVLSDAQKATLRSAGFDPNDIDYARGKQLCGIIIERRKNGKCTFAQAKTLKKYKLDSETSFENASLMITAIAENGWRGLPNGFELPTPVEDVKVPDSINDVPMPFEDEVPF